MSKYYYKIVPDKITGPPPHIFTYESNVKFEVGQLSAIKVGTRDFRGVVLEEVVKPVFKTKKATGLDGKVVVPKTLLDTLIWISAYYLCPLPLVIAQVLSSQKNSPPVNTPLMKPIQRKTDNNSTPPLTKEQDSVISSILQSEQGTFLVKGITGSGKTRVYLEIAKQVIQKGKSVLVLVPEISLTSQMRDWFAEVIDNEIYITHSNMKVSERNKIWQNIVSAKEPFVLIGPRSALFAPISNLGLIVVDEFHDQAYKQEQAPKFHAIRVASKLAQINQARLILGSATPPIAELKFANDKRVQILQLTKPAVSNAVLPEVTVVDMRSTIKVSTKYWLSLELKKAMDKSLSNNEQILLYYNRRGSATLSMCQKCGWVHKCHKCHLPLTLHADIQSTLCHICGKSESVPLQCPDCQSTYVAFKGIGTKQIETDIKTLFPGVNIGRFDSDTKKHEAVEARFQDMVDGNIQIIIGTQMIAKGLDLPKLGLVGVILPDISMNLPDFTSSEKTFQLLYQVIGRVGRHRHSDKVIVQTYQPDNPAIKFALRRDYGAFYKHEIIQRKFSRFPPFKHLMKITCSYSTPSKAKIELTKFKNQIVNLKDIEVLGPVPAFHERVNNKYRWQLVCKTSNRKLLVDLARNINSNWTVDLDPINLL